MNVVFDAGALRAFPAQPARLQELLRRGLWPAQVPSVVLTEALTGDHRRDFPVDRLLRACQVRSVDEVLARRAARLRTATGRAGAISAVDAVVVALAEALGGGWVFTSDPRDLRALADLAASPITVVAV
ncbi:MAG: PIN domain-containing protein [Jatrophihabitans sp.]|nr:MAG: PIN domain-containing protein [Jatrophihabitans sp.]